MSILQPNESIVTTAAVAAVVVGIYQRALPSAAETRASQPADIDLEQSERVAAWTSAAVVGGVALAAKDPSIFVMGGAMIVALSWWQRHSNLVNPMTGQLESYRMTRDDDMARDAAKVA